MNRPRVIINCAMSADGKIALPNRKQLKISCEEDIQRMYQLRNACDAVLVGVGTILSDNPKLTVKETYVKHPRHPLRIILDTRCRTPVDALAVNQTANTLLITAKPCAKTYPGTVDIVQCETDEHGLIDLPHVLNMLYQRGIKTLMVEGGSTVIWNFLRKKVVDDMYLYIGPLVIGGEHTPTLAEGSGVKRSNEVIPLEIVDVKRLGPGILLHYRMIP